MDNRKPQKLLEDGQFAKAVYLRMMSAMKEILDLGKYKIGDKDSDDFKYFKKKVMDEFYNAMTDLFERMEERGQVKKCPCGAKIREGYTTCPLCSGAGYCNA